MQRLADLKPAVAVLNPVLGQFRQGPVDLILREPHGRESERVFKDAERAFVVVLVIAAAAAGRLALRAP